VSGRNKIPACAKPCLLATIMKKQSVNIKAKLIALNYLLPLLAGLFIYLVFDTSNSLYNLMIAGDLFCGLALSIVFKERKYLYCIVITVDQVEFKYLTVFLESKSDWFGKEMLAEVETSKSNWIAGYPKAVQFNCDGIWIEYQLINEKMHKFIQDNLAAANIGLVK
jgi:hypothetical protein